MRFEIVDIGWLKPHEEIKPGRLEEMIFKIKNRSIFHKPILVDLETGTILDGHHRYNASLTLGFSKIPAMLIDYLNDSTISVDVWPNCGIETITKQDVLNMAQSGNVYPPKTSKHELNFELKKIEVPISELI